MRSKQVLNVFDEKLLEISKKESEELFFKNGLSRAEGRTAHGDSFGRAWEANADPRIKKTCPPYLHVNLRRSFALSPGVICFRAVVS
jgi:hypothetical protein